MTELLIIFQLHTDKKTITVSNMMLPIPKGLSNAELITLIKDTLATIEGAGAILNIINMNTINYPKVEPKEHTPRPERSSFGPKRETSYGNKGGYGAKPSFDSHREDKPYRERPQREDRPSSRYASNSGTQREERSPRSSGNSYGSQREGGSFRGKPKSSGGYNRPSGGSYSKGGDRGSRPSRPR